MNNLKYSDDISMFLPRGSKHTDSARQNQARRMKGEFVSNFYSFFHPIFAEAEFQKDNDKREQSLHIWASFAEQGPLNLKLIRNQFLI